MQLRIEVLVRTYTGRTFRRGVCSRNPQILRNLRRAGFGLPDLRVRRKRQLGGHVGPRMVDRLHLASMHGLCNPFREILRPRNELE